MELEDAGIAFIPPKDGRPRLPEPPPIRLVTVDDAHLPARAGVERQLDEFYCGLLRLERDHLCEFPVYRSENFRIIFDVLEPPIHRESLRALAVEVPSVGAIEQKLIDGEIDFTRQRGLLAGQDRLVLLDPAGNWIEIAEWREIG